MMVLKCWMRYGRKEKREGQIQMGKDSLSKDMVTATAKGIMEKKCY